MKECKKCLFNSGNYPAIQLNDDGICDICETNIKKIHSIKGAKTKENLERNIRDIKNAKSGEYDCLIGVSGGADSTYLVYLAKEWGLNPLLFHVDGGWNSEISVSNIKKLVEKSGFDYVAEVLPWEEIKEVERAFVKANVLDIDLPFDNLMISYNYRIAQKYNIKNVLIGSSSDTEGIMPSHFTHYKYDKKNILSVFKKWGNRKINNLKFIGTIEYLWFSKVKKIQMASPLDWIDYNKENAKNIIISQFEWKDYGWKHNENVYTRFYQNYILPKKFGIDKRVSHLSMLICSDQLTKTEGKAMLANTPMYSDPKAEDLDKEFFIKKLSFTPQEFEIYMRTDPVSHRTYKSELDLYDFFRPIYRFVKKRFGFKVFGV